MRTDVSIGSWKIARTTLLFAGMPVFAQFGGADEPVAILGGDVLKDRRFVVDYPAQRLWQFGE